MLVDFYIENYKSFNERAKFSLVADNNKARGKNFFIETDFRLDNKPLNLLSFSCVFGANASGKSNILRSFYDFIRLLHFSLKDTEPFDIFYSGRDKLNAEENELLAFGVSFIIDDNYYNYELKIDKDQVLYECLQIKNYKPRSQFKTLFKRDLGQYKFHHSLSKKVKDGKILVNEKALFLSLATVVKSETLSSVFEYLTRKIEIQLSNSFFSSYSQFRTTNSLADEKIKKQDVLKFLKATDILIDDIDIQERKIEGKVTIKIGDGEEETIDGSPSPIKKAIFQIYDTKQNLVNFDEKEVSSGTMKIYGLASQFINAINKGSILFIDEMDRSMHPKAVYFLIHLFSNKETNPNNAQLVITTHDPLIFDYPLIHKDQIYLIDKNKHQSELIRLDEYEIDKRRDLLKMYLDGVFGGVPQISSISLLA